MPFVLKSESNVRIGKGKVVLLHAMKIYRSRDIAPPLNLTTRRSVEWSCSHPGYFALGGGTVVAQWLRCCATNWRVSGSIPVAFEKPNEKVV